MNEDKTRKELTAIEKVLKSFGLKRVLNEQGHRIYAQKGARDVYIAVELIWDKYGDTPSVSIGIVDHDIAKAMNVLTGIPIKYVENRLSFSVACQATSLDKGKFGITESIEDTMIRLKAWLAYVEEYGESIVDDYINSIELYKLPSFFVDCVQSFEGYDIYWVNASLYLVSLKKKIANNALTVSFLEKTLESAKDNGFDIESNYELGIIKNFVYDKA